MIDQQRTTHRVKRWAYENAVTIFWLHIIEVAMLLLLVLR